MPSFSIATWKKKRHADAEGSGVAAAIKTFDKAWLSNLKNSTDAQITAAKDAVKGLDTALNKATGKLKTSKSKDAKIDETNKLIEEWKKELKICSSTLSNFEDNRDKLAGKQEALRDKWTQTSIAKAAAIYDGWTAQANSYLAQFHAEKKTAVAAAKAELRDLQAIVEAGVPPLKLKSVLIRIAAVTKSLKEAMARMETVYEQYKTWSGGDPRSSLKAIAKQIDIEKEADIREKVAAGTKTKLLENAAAIAAAGVAWTNDLKIALQHLLDTAAAVDKIARASGGKGEAYDALLAKEQDTLKQLLGRVLKDFRVKKLEQAKSVGFNIKKYGRPMEADDAKASRQLEQDLRNSVAMLDKVLATFTKQKERIQKSVPAQVWASSPLRGQIEKLIDDSVTEAGEMREEVTDAVRRVVEHNSKVPA